MNKRVFRIRNIGGYFFIQEKRWVWWTNKIKVNLTSEADAYVQSKFYTLIGAETQLHKIVSDGFFTDYE